MKYVRFSQRIAVLVIFSGALVAVALAAAPNSATIPVPRPYDWMQRHESINARVKQGNVDLIFIGDSITHGLETTGRDA
jgi:beta-glucosidase